MGTKIFIRDLEAVNFDKLVALALESCTVLGLSPDELQPVVGEQTDASIDLEGLVDPYRGPNIRSLTEAYAVHRGLVTADADGHAIQSKIPGLVSLCTVLAENHGKVAGVQGGGLYRKGLIPNFARNLPLLAGDAPALIVKIIGAIVAVLKNPDAKLALVGLSLEREWVGIATRFGCAEQQVMNEARRMACDLRARDLENARTFDLRHAPDTKGLVLVTKNPNLMKHLWRALGDLRAPIGVALVKNPHTGRIALLTASLVKVDLHAVEASLHAGFPGARFDVNHAAGRVIWDPSVSEAPGPGIDAFQEIVRKDLSFVRDASIPNAVPAPSMKVSIGDRHASKRA